MNLSRITQISSGECSRSNRSFAITFAFVCAITAILPVRSVQAESAVAIEESAAAIEEIIVTARKREESLQEVPVAVTVLTSEMIESQRIEGIKDLGTIVPGLVTTETVSSTYGNVYLRGVGSGALSVVMDQAVSVNIDGVGISSAALMNAGLFDLDRIEVLRGPQALFYGKNSPGGVIAIHTKDPTDVFEFELTAMYETEGDEPIVRAVVSGPLGDTLSGRLSMGWSDAGKSRFEWHNFDVFETGPDGNPVQTAFATSSDPVETEKFYAMGTLLWEPTDSLAATLKYAYLEDTQEGHTNFNFQRSHCGQGAPQVIYPVPGVDNCKMDGNVEIGSSNPAFGAIDPNFPGYTGNGFYENQENFVSLEINYGISDTLDLASVTGYYNNDMERIGDASFELASNLFNSVLRDIEQWSQELRLNSNYDGNFNFMVGSYYEEKEIYQQNAVVLGSNRIGLPVSAVGILAIPIGQQFTVQDSSAWSVFTELTWNLNDQWAVSAGARYSYEEKEAAMDVNFFAPAPSGGPKTNIPLLEDKPDWNNFSPQVTLSYFYNDDIMFFASYKEGFKSGGFDAAWNAPGLLAAYGVTGIPFDNVYDEEEVDGFEAGMKSTLLDGTLRFNVTAYSYEYDGLQLTKAEFVNGIPSFRVQNAASASVEGLELETFWRTPVDGLTLTANLAFNNAEYDDFVTSCFTGQTIAQGCALNPDPVTGNFTAEDLSGESLPNASDLSATLALDYVVAVGNNWNLSFNVTSSYKDEYNPSTVLLPKDWWQDSYWVTNASVSLFSSDDKWEFFARGINLGGEYYSATASVTGGNGSLTGTNDPSGQPDVYKFVNGGEQYMLGVKYRM